MMTGLSARNAEIRRRVRLGEPPRKLALEFGVTRQWISYLKLWEPPIPKPPKPPKTPNRRFYGTFICRAGNHPTMATLTRYAPRKYACPECLPGVVPADA